MAKKKDEEVITGYKLKSKRIRKTTKKVAYEDTPLAKTKKWESEKKSKTFERLQAVSRHREYMKEYKKLKELDGESLEIELLEIYKEKYKSGKRKPVYVMGKDYQKFQAYLNKNTEYQKKLLAIRKRVEKNLLKKTKHEDEMIKKWKVEELPRLWFPDYIIEPQSQYPDRPAVVELKSIPAKFKKGYLHLRVDLSRGKGLIIQEIREIVGKYLKTTKHREIQDSIYGRPITPFEVYDMVHRGDKMRLIDIARELLSGNKKITSSDAAYSTISRAYKAAKSKIDNVIQNKKTPPELALSTTCTNK